MFVQTQIWRELRVVLHKPSLKKKELWESEMVSLNQSTLELYVCPSRMLDRSMYVQDYVGGRSLMCVHHAWEVSSTLILVPILFDKEKQKWK